MFYYIYYNILDRNNPFFKSKIICVNKRILVRMRKHAELESYKYHFIYDHGNIIIIKGFTVDFKLPVYT